MTHSAIFAAAKGPLTIAVLVLAEASILQVASSLDPLRNANRQLGFEAFRWWVVTEDGGPVSLTCGLSLPSSGPLMAAKGADALIVIAGFHQSDRAPAKLIRSLRRIAPGFALIGGVDAGPWVMARAGLLDGYRATVHWEDLEDFATAFPDTWTVPDRYVIDRDRVTAGGAAAAAEIMLHLIGARHGAPLARQVAHSFLIAPRAGEEPQIGPPQAGRSQDPRVEAAIARMEALVETPERISETAQAVGVSTRQLEKLFRRDLGVSPAAHAMTLRLQVARRLLSDTHHPLAEIALRTGFSGPSTFGRAFQRFYGKTPRQVRER